MASHKGHAKDAPVFGISAEFASAHGLLEGVRHLRPHHLGALETHSPIPIHGLSEALGTTGSLRRYAIVGAGLGFVAMMAMCIYATASDYVFNIGGRPLVSWPSFVVPSVSFAMLTGALATMLALLVTNRLPRLNHPSFNIPNFTRASQDRYFLTVVPSDPAADLGVIERALDGLAERPVAVARVPR